MIGTRENSTYAYRIKSHLPSLRIFTKLLNLICSFWFSFHPFRALWSVRRPFLPMLLIKLVVIQKNLWSVHNTFSPIGTVERHMPCNFSSIMVLLYCCWSSHFHSSSLFPFYVQMHSTLEANKIFMCIVQQHFDQIYSLYTFYVCMLHHSLAGNFLLN